MAVLERLGVDELFRNEGYDAVLDIFQHRIAVTGTRGKSSMTRWLHDALHDRGYGTVAKITGDHPKTIVDGEVEPIEREGPQVRLYENEDVLRRAASRVDATDGAVAVCENHGLREYTMRVFNERFLRPDLVVLTNVRQDHTDTLGSTRQDIARSFARSVPPGTHVISGETQPVLRRYLEEELAKRGATVEHVAPDEGDAHRVGATMVGVLDAALREVDGEGLAWGRRERLLRELRPVWHHLPGGRVANAAPVNDVESTEIVRRALAGEGPHAETITPFVFLRDDRRGRTASFVEYGELLVERGLADEIHVGGRDSGAFAERCDAPVRRHDAAPSRADAVLDHLLATGRPVMLMANAVDPFMRALVDETERRAVDTTPTRRDPGREDWHRRDRDDWADVKPVSPPSDADGDER